MGFVEIILDIKTKYVSLLRLRMLVETVSELLPQLCSNDSIQILLELSWFLTLGTKLANFYMDLYEVIRAKPWQYLITNWWQNAKFRHGGIFHLDLFEYYNHLVISQINVL